MPKNKVLGGSGYTKIYLSKLSKDGTLLAEKYYGGSDFDTLYQAKYINGKGVALTISSQSKDGDFKASKEGYSTSILAFADENLNLCWYKIIDEDVFFDGLFTANENIYLLTSSNKYKLCRFNLNGEEINSKIISYDNTNFIPNQSGYILMQQNNKIIKYDDFNIQQEMEFNGGTALKAIKYKDFLLILSSNITGTVPTPPYVSAILYNTELVYSAYNDNGILIWRDAFDNTPEFIKNYQKD